MSFASLLNRVAHAIFDPSRPGRRPQPQSVPVEPTSSPVPQGADQAAGLVALAKEVGALPAAVMIHPNQPLVVPADQLVTESPLLRRQYTARSMLN